MNVAIIVAGGRGERMGGAQPKQFRELAGVPVIVHTLRRFDESQTIDQVVVVVPAADAAGFAAWAEQLQLTKLARIIHGGPTRTASVARGLETLNHAKVNVVAVHDGVRPFVTPEEIDATVRAADESGAAILVAPAIDTIKVVADGQVTQTLARTAVRHALTPQCFRYEVLRRAYDQAMHEGVDATDDSLLVERLGISVRVVEGSARNFKLTRPQDFALAEILLQEMT